MIPKTFEKVTLQQKFYFDTLKNQIAILNTPILQDSCMNLHDKARSVVLNKILMCKTMLRRM